MLSIKNDPKLFYIILAYGITWSIIFPLAFLYNDLNPIFRELWHAFGPIGPTIASIIIIRYSKGKNGLKVLWERCKIYAGILLLLFALSPIIIFSISFIIENIIGTFTLTDFIVQNNLASVLSIFLFLLPSFSYGIFEEIGWRGFLLPEYQKKYNALISTLILTIIWWLWHIPMFFYRFELFFALIFMPLLMLSGSILFTFLFNQSGGSILMVIILHVSYDLISAHNTGFAVMILSIMWVILDIIIIIKFKVQNLSTKERVIL